MQHESASHLPAPDTASAAHSARVAAHIRERIGSGAIGFAEYVQEALYARGLGYYTAGSTKLGRDGDFITAPEISPLFGQLLARQIAEVLGNVGDADILEVGAGSGALAVHLLQALHKRDSLPGHYRILEISADLAQRQQQRLQDTSPQLSERVEWLSEWPQDFRGVVVANEVLDALPFERFVRRSADVMQASVVNAGEKFGWAERPAPQGLRDAVIAIEEDIGGTLPAGYTSDVTLAIDPWVAELSACLSHGVAFLLDYGVSRREYYAPDRSSGWLRCHFRHRAHNDPLILPGIQDITTWVDFTRVAEAATSTGMDILGFLPQAQFLIGAGLDEELQQLTSLSQKEQLALSGQVKTLTLPGEMGEHFKCMALGRGDVPTPSAFHFADRTRTL